MCGRLRWLPVDYRRLFQSHLYGGGGDDRALLGHDVQVFSVKESLHPREISLEFRPRKRYRINAEHHHELGAILIRGLLLCLQQGCSCLLLLQQTQRLLQES